MLTLFFSLLFTSRSVAAAPEGYLGSQVGLDTSSLISFSSPNNIGLSGNVDELAEGKQRSFFFNNANPEPFLISGGDNGCSRPNGNQIPNSKRRSKRQSSEICPFNSFVRSGPNNKPKTSPSTKYKWTGRGYGTTFYATRFKTSSSYTTCARQEQLRR